MKNSTVRNIVLASFLALGVGFPVTMALTNGHAAPAPAPMAASGDVQIGPVVVVEDMGGEAILLPARPVKRPATAHHATTSATPTPCHRIELEQQSRPGARTVLACNI